MKEKDYTQYCDLLDKTIIPSFLPQKEKEAIYNPLGDWIVKHTPAKLFKFRNCNEKNISAFRNQQIWFSTSTNMNDDYDAIIYCDKEKIIDEINNLFSNDNLFRFLNDLRNGETTPTFFYETFGENYIKNAKEVLQNKKEEDLLYFCQSIKQWVENGFKLQFPSISQASQKVTKFSSFSEDINSPLMWGHYADNSTGFALGYDFRHKYNECDSCPKLGVSCFCPKKNTLFPMVYGKKLLDATEYGRYLMQYAWTRKLLFDLKVPEILQQKILSTIICSDIFMQTKVLLHKFSSWAYEKEWRMTVSYDSPSYTTDQVANIWKKPCALYLGRKIKDTDELILRNIAYQQKIPVYKMEIDYKSDEYRLIPIQQRNLRKDLILNSGKENQF